MIEIFSDPLSLVVAIGFVLSVVATFVAFVLIVLNDDDY